MTKEGLLKLAVEMKIESLQRDFTLDELTSDSFIAGVYLSCKCILNWIKSDDDLVSDIKSMIDEELNLNKEAK